MVLLLLQEWIMSFLADQHGISYVGGRYFVALPVSIASDWYCKCLNAGFQALLAVRDDLEPWYSVTGWKGLEKCRQGEERNDQEAE